MTSEPMMPAELTTPSDAMTRSEPMTYPSADTAQHIALVDLLDRLLAGGVVIAGEITLGIADVDLVRISLRALVSSVRAAIEPEGRARS